MKKTHPIWTTTLFFLAVSFFIPLSASGETAHKRLFIIHSYEQNHICGQPQHDGAIAALKEAGWREGENLDVGVYYMDTKRTNNTPALIQEQAEKAKKDIAAFQPDVVLTLDDNAFRTLALPEAGTKIPYVFSGMNGQPETYDAAKEFMVSRAHPGSNITGVYEKLYIREAIRVLSTMHQLERIVFLGDESPTGKAINTQFDLETIPDSASPLTSTLEKRINHSWEEFQANLEDINADNSIGGIYLGTLLLKDASGQTHTASDIIQYTLGNTRKPTIGLNYAFIKLGLFGGATVDFYAMGKLAGTKIAAIFGGELAGDLPIEDAPRVALVFNLARAETIGLNIPSDILMAADEVFRK